MSKEIYDLNVDSLMNSNINESAKNESTEKDYKEAIDELTKAISESVELLKTLKGENIVENKEMTWDEIADSLISEMAKIEEKEDSSLLDSKLEEYSERVEKSEIKEVTKLHKKIYKGVKEKIKSEGYVFIREDILTPLIILAFYSAIGLAVPGGSGIIFSAALISSLVTIIQKATPGAINYNQLLGTSANQFIQIIGVTYASKEGIQELLEKLNKEFKDDLGEKYFLNSGRTNETLNDQFVAKIFGGKKEGYETYNIFIDKKEDK